MDSEVMNFKKYEALINYFAHKAHRSVNKDLEYDDIFQDLCETWWKGIDTYDPSTGAKFSTYLYALLNFKCLKIRKRYLDDMDFRVSQAKNTIRLSLLEDDKSIQDIDHLEMVSAIDRVFPLRFNPYLWIKFTPVGLPNSYHNYHKYLHLSNRMNFLAHACLNEPELSNAELGRKFGKTKMWAKRAKRRMWKKLKKGI